jgi:hypothetical protein
MSPSADVPYYYFQNQAEQSCVLAYEWNAGSFTPKKTASFQEKKWKRLWHSAL